MKTTDKGETIVDLNTGTILREEPVRRNRSLKIPLILFVLAMLYDFFPLDVLPDFIPLGGWVDDVTITLFASLNLLEKALIDNAQGFGRLIRLLKWALTLIGIMAVSIGVLSIYGIFKIIF